MATTQNTRHSLFAQIIRTTSAAENCPICLEGYRSPACLRCEHVYCLPCIEEHAKLNRRQCPLCRRRFRSAYLLLEGDICRLPARHDERGNAGKKEKDSGQDGQDDAEERGIGRIMTWLEGGETFGPHLGLPDRLHEVGQGGLGGEETEDEGSESEEEGYDELEDRETIFTGRDSVDTAFVPEASEVSDDDDDDHDDEDDDDDVDMDDLDDLGGSDEDKIRDAGNQ